MSEGLGNLRAEQVERLTANLYDAIAAYQRLTATVETLGAHLLVIESLLREARRGTEPRPTFTVQEVQP